MSMNNSLGKHYISILSTRNVIWTLRGGGGGGVAPVTFVGEKSWKISFFFKFLIFLNHLCKLTYKIQHFRKCICILGIFLCSLSGPGLAPSVPLYFYAQHSILKPAPASGTWAELKNVRDVSKRGWGGGGSSDKRPYDVSRGQYQYVTLPLY